MRLFSTDKPTVRPFCLRISNTENGRRSSGSSRSPVFSITNWPGAARCRNLGRGQPRTL